LLGIVQAKKDARMKHIFYASTLLACMLVSTMTFAQANGAPPGNKSPQSDTEGKAAGYSGGAGAAGQAGTDPATLKRTEEERVRKNNASGKRKDWKE
jgi:hypothetical protein